MVQTDGPEESLRSSPSAPGYIREDESQNPDEEMKPMPRHRYRYRLGGHVGTLIMGQGDEPCHFHTEDGRVYPLAPGDLLQLDTPEAAFLAQADALVSAWRDLCQTAADLPDPEAARRTLCDALDAMQRAVHHPRRTWRCTP
jgi:hypothetical protein